MAGRRLATSLAPISGRVACLAAPRDPGAYDTNWPSSVDRGARVFASRQPIESCGRGSRRHGAAGTRRSQPLRNTFPENDAPRYLRHDRDSVLADVATTIERMNIQEVRTAPRSPWQNAYVERVIGSIRRECVDHVIVMNAAGLHRLLTEYVAYYNDVSYCPTSLCA